MGHKRTYTLRDGREIPRLGQGTWYMGEDRSRRSAEIEALQLGIELGMTLLDTAEMYGEGKAEKLIGEAIRDVSREKLFIVSKVYPHNAGRRNLERSLDASLARMGTGYLDLYLLHWRGGIPLRETAEEMERMVRTGKIKGWGVSNLDLDDMKELMETGLGERCLTDQVLYHLGSRGVEYDLQPWLEKNDISLMAYCPLAEAGLLRQGIMSNETVTKIAQSHDMTPAQVMLGFLLRKENVIVIPKAGSVKHVRENARALECVLSEEELRALDACFPAPTCPVPLDVV
ncbi:MAG: aldo/keto reductase [Firmicutes bacterium]|nr:aldo/keto reductase [Bacillota bacterium]